MLGREGDEELAEDAERDGCFSWFREPILMRHVNACRSRKTRNDSSSEWLREGIRIRHVVARSNLAEDAERRLRLRDREHLNGGVRARRARARVVVGVGCKGEHMNAWVTSHGSRRIVRCTSFANTHDLCLPSQLCEKANTDLYHLSYLVRMIALPFYLSSISRTQRTVISRTQTMARMTSLCRPTQRLVFATPSSRRRPVCAAHTHTSHLERRLVGRREQVVADRRAQRRLLLARQQHISTTQRHNSTTAQRNNTTTQ